MKIYDLVDKCCYETDPFHAPYETIKAESIGKAKSMYKMMYREYRYIDILCRISKKHSYNIPDYL